MLRMGLARINIRYQYNNIPYIYIVDDRYRIYTPCTAVCLVIFLPKFRVMYVSGQPKLCVAKEQCRSNFYSNSRGACISRDVVPLELRAAPPGTHAMSREEWKGVCGTTISKFLHSLMLLPKIAHPGTIAAFCCCFCP